MVISGWVGRGWVLSKGRKGMRIVGDEERGTCSGRSRNVDTTRRVSRTSAARSVCEHDDQSRQSTKCRSMNTQSEDVVRPEGDGAV